MGYAGLWDAISPWFTVLFWVGALVWTIFYVTRDK